jgi:D-alanine-D-alanine ligase
VTASPPARESPRVLVLSGGLSHEREVSLRSGRRVADALRESGCEVLESDLDAALLPRLREDRPDVVWPLLHGATGEDGSVRDVLEAVGVPYVGADAAACRRAFDKPTANDLVGRAGVAVPASVSLPHSLFRELGASEVLGALTARLGLPLVVKPARGGSALGVATVADAAELPRAMVGCFAYGEVALVQRAVTGTEVTVAVVDTGTGPQALPAVEIVTAGTAYDYDARYTAGRTQYFAPARLDEATSTALADLAVRVHTVLGLRDLSRTDVIVTGAADGDPTPWFLEVNVAPGMTETSLLPQAAAAAGLDLPRLYRGIVDAAVSRVG